MSEQMESKPGHIQALTGLRFFAALLVFVHHIGGMFGIPKIHLPLGAIGVTFFFVLSGFILVYVYHDKLKNRSSLWKFYFARFARIWPLHFACLLIGIFVVVGYSNSVSQPGQLSKLFAHLFLLQSWVPESSWIFNFNAVSWSISTEFFFYLMFPILMLIGWGRFWKTFLAVAFINAGIIVALQLYANQHGTVFLNGCEFKNLIHFNPAMRIFEFMCGMGVGRVFLLRTSLTKTRKPDKVKATAIELIGVAGLIAYLACWAMLIRYYYPNESLRAVTLQWLTTSGTVFAFVPFVYLFATSSGLIARFMAARPIVYLGEISFAFYMVHYLVLNFLSAYQPEVLGLSPTTAGIAVLLLTIGCSAILFEFWEMPVKRALMAAYQLKWSSAITGIFCDGYRLLNSTTTVRIAVVLLVSILMIQSGGRNIGLNDQEIQTVVAQSNIGGPVQFQNEATLLAACGTESENGIELKLVWKKHQNQMRSRFIHIVDQHGKIVRQAGSAPGRFSTKRPNQIWLETVHLTAQELIDGHTIGVGFWKQDLGCARVLSGKRSMNNQRLDVFTIRTSGQLQHPVVRSASSSNTDHR